MKCHTKDGRPPAGTAIAAVLAAALGVACAGCQQAAILWFHMTGGDTVKAEFTLTKNRLAVVLDDPQGLIVIPSVPRNFHELLAKEFTSNKIETNLVEFEEVDRVQREAGYDELSIRAIGEKLGAEQILFLKVSDFRLKDEPASPVYKGRFAVRVSVVATERKRDVRLWPQQEGGQEVAAETTPEYSDAASTGADVAKRLSAELAKEVAKLFYDHKEIE